MLIGRAPEQQAINRLVAAARIGESGVLVITGEPGVGKTALLSDARTRIEGFRLLFATGTEAEREIPFAGLLSVLRPALGLLDAIPGPQALALSAALALRPGSSTDRFDRFAIGAATLSLVCSYAEEKPVAIVVDDLHLLDRPSAEAMVFAARRLAADPVVLVLAARTGESDDVVAGLPTLPLAGLDPGSARDLLQTAGGEFVTDEQLSRLHQATAGNPLAMLELGGNLDALEHAPPHLPPPVSTTVAESFTKRVRLLDPAARSALLAAVVASGDLRTTTAVCERLGVDPARLSDAQRASLISLSGDRVDFRHPLLRAAVYAEASVHERRAAHRAVADALPSYDTDRRAWHLSESVWTPDGEIAGLLEAVGKRAVDRAAYAVASTAYERAARLSPQPAHQVDQLVKAAETAWSAGLGHRARTLLDELQALSSPPAVVLELRASIAGRTGSLVEARDMLEQAASRDQPADAEVALLAEAVQVALYLADARGSLRLADRIANTLVAVTSPQTKAIGTVAVGMAKVLAGRGGTEELRTSVALLADTADGHPGRPWLLPWLMLAPLFLRELDAGAGLRQVVEDARSRAGVGTLPSLLFLVARDQATSDSWARAEANYTEAIRLAREIGQSTELAISLAGLAWLESRQGREADCRAHAAEALPICTDRHIQLGRTWIQFALGDLELAMGRPHAAVVELQRLTALLEDLGVGDSDLSPGPELADALLRVGRPDDAREVADSHHAAAYAKGQPWSCARAERAMGLLAPDSEIDRRFRTALAFHEQTPDSFETARTRLAYGARLRRAGRRVDARPELREALTIFDGLGAEPWVGQAAAELDATGEKARRRQSAGIASLTPQELQVSLLLADGRTTREAAAALFLSPKTVEYHLRKAYQKLGIRSRAELSARLPH